MDKYTILEEYVDYFVANLGHEGMESYLWIDEGGEHGFGTRQKGSFGEVDDSYIFITTNLSQMDYDHIIGDWFSDENDDWNDFYEQLVNETDDIVSFKDYLYQELLDYINNSKFEDKFSSL